jgi:uncharacterized protein YjbI with pentapeptide repeats
MQTAKLKNRWNFDEWLNIKKAILNALSTKSPIENISGMSEIANRMDLRGLELISTREDKLCFKKSILKNVDLSYSDLRFIEWDKCIFENVYFEGSNLKQSTFTSSKFINCVFKKTNISVSYLASSWGLDSGHFIDCQFIESNLSESVLHFPVIENCIFASSNLHATEFDGSRFKDCTFGGLVDSPFFRGYSRYTENFLGKYLGGYNKKKHCNKMINVDFSQAVMRDVVFSDGIDLTKTKFPQGEEYIFIKDIASTFKRVRKIIDTSWEGEDKRVGLFLIDNWYYSKNPNKLEQASDFIDAISREESFPDLAPKFFRLIRDCNS